MTDELLSSCRKQHNGYSCADQSEACTMESINSDEIVRYTAAVGLDNLKIYKISGMHCYHYVQSVKELLEMWTVCSQLRFL